MDNRISQSLAAAESVGLDALALVPGPNLLYLTGMSFHLSERPIVALLPADGRPSIVLPELEAGKAAAAGFDTYTYTDEDGHAFAYSQACATLELADARVGVEILGMRLLEARTIQRFAPNVELVPVDGLFAELRMVKTAEELDTMRRAVRVAEEAFLAWVPMLRAGMSEREAAALLVGALLGGGADRLAFDPIVAGGPHGSLPHAVPGDRAFQAGDWIVVDWGAVVDGYCSDLTRMVVVGEPAGQMREIHQIVLAANDAGRAAVAPGLEAQAVDAAARAAIEAAGYGRRFFHRTGHGLGLEAHEPPYIVSGNQLSLAPGMTFTVEPGIYLPDVGGVRIEDDVVVTLTGGESLTTLSRAPFVVPA
ncbi:MAG: Xaa-Pro peptidase family protein [Anaerolineae bacterium]|nr:Xaa-Pro peptidase family protein [Anaerolineae bacterium]